MCCTTPNLKRMPRLGLIEATQGWGGIEACVSKNPVKENRMLCRGRAYRSRGPIRRVTGIPKAAVAIVIPDGLIYR